MPCLWMWCIPCCKRWYPCCKRWGPCSRTHLLYSQSHVSGQGSLSSQVGTYHIRLHEIFHKVYHLRGLGSCSLRRVYHVYDLHFFKFSLNLLPHMGVQAHILDNRDHILEIYLYNKYICIINIFLYITRVLYKTQVLPMMLVWMMDS